MRLGEKPICPHSKTVVRVRRYANCHDVADIDVVCSKDCGTGETLKKFFVRGADFGPDAQDFLDPELALTEIQLSVAKKVLDSIEGLRTKEEEQI